MLNDILNEEGLIRVWSKIKSLTSGSIGSAISTHNTDNSTHSDIRGNISDIQEVIPESASTMDKLVTNTQMSEAIQRNANQPVLANQDFTSPFAVQSSTYKSLIGGTVTCLEIGPWYKVKDGVVHECGSASGVYVSTNDTTIVLADESKFFFYAHSIKYQRIKTGSGWGKINLPDGNQTDLIQTTFRTKMSLYFYDDSETVHEGKRVIFVTFFENMPSKVDAVMEFVVEQTDTIDDIADSTLPEHTYDLIFPAAKYFCSVAQTETTAPVWALLMTLNDTEFSQEWIDALNSGINATKVRQIAELVADMPNKVNKSGDTMTGALNMSESIKINFPSNGYETYFLQKFGANLSIGRTNGDSADLILARVFTNGLAVRALYITTGAATADNQVLKRSDGDARWLQIAPPVSSTATLVSGSFNELGTINYSTIALPANPGTAEYNGTFTSTTSGDIRNNTGLSSITKWQGDVTIEANATYSFCFQNGNGVIVKML